MKNKLKILSIFAIIAIIFIGVDLKEVKALGQISYKENGICSVEETECRVEYNSPQIDNDNDNITVLDIEVHYVINGQDYTSDAVPSQVKVLTEYLKQTENTVTVYEKNKKTNDETNRININLIAAHKSKEVENLPDNDLKIYMTLDIAPIDVKVSMKKVTDNNVLNKLGTNYVYRFQLLSGSKNIYDLNLDGIGRFNTLLNTKVKIEIPSEIRGKLNTQDSHNEKEYFLYTSDLNLNFVPYLGSPEAIENDYAIFDSISLTDSADYYIYFKPDALVDMNNSSSKTIRNVPNTAANKTIIIIVVAIILIGAGSVIVYKVTKDKKQNIK